MGKPMRTVVLVAGFGALALTAGAALAQPRAQSAKKPAPQCFRSSDWRGWKATPDGKTMYIETGLKRVWRLDLTQACPELNQINARLVTRTTGSWTCQPIDIDMKVLQPGPGAFGSYCQVKTITRLTPEQAKGLPKALQP